MATSAELYGRYVVPEQPSSTLRVDDEGASALGAMLFSVGHVSHLMYHTLLERAGSDSADHRVEAAQDFAGRVAAAAGLDLLRDDVSFGARTERRFAVALDDHGMP